MTLPLWKRRRVLLATSMVGGLLASPGFGIASSLTGIDALDNAAMDVKQPADVLLEAVTVAGDRIVAVGQHGVIIYSDDNGVSWSQANVPVNVTLTCVGFATPMLGWAAGHFGVILNTTDGGKTWYTQLNGIQANRLTLLAAQDMPQNSALPAAPFALRRAEIFVQGGPNKPFLSLIVLSPVKVIVFGAYRMTMITNDGGKTWADWSLQIGDRLSHNLYAVANTASGIYVAGEAGMVFRSTDGGDSFPALASPSDVTLFGVLGANDRSIIVFGVAGNGFRSIDAGTTWQPINLNTQDNLTAGLVLSSGLVLIGSETGALYVSKDNGATFAAVQGLAPTSIFALAQAPNSDLILAGSAGVTRQPLVILTH